MDPTDARSRTEGRPRRSGTRSRRENPAPPAARPRPGRHRDSAGVQARRRIALLVTAAALVSAGLGVARAVAGPDEPSTQAASLVQQPARPSSTPTGAASSRSAAPSTTVNTPAAPVSSTRAGTPTTDKNDKPSSSPPSGPAGPGRSAVPVPERGNGKMTTVQASGHDTTGGRPVTYTIEVEQETGVEPQKAADFIAGVLRDPKGWERLDGIRFVQLSPAERAKGTRPKVRIVLASPATTDRLCAPLSTEGKLSCGTDGRAVLNLRPWLNGTPWHGGPQKAELYRTYLVNHEVGHLIGRGHVGCPKAGDRSPVMLQQTKGLQGCTANPWPSLTRG